MAGTLAILERNLITYKRNWRASVFSSFVLPLLFIISIGIGVGRYVGTVNGWDYLSFIVPGVLAAGAFQTAHGESTFAVMSDFKWSRAYHAMRATPLRIGHMIGGWQLYIQIRVFIGSAIFLAVSALFGAVHSPWVLATPLVCALLALAVGAPVSAFAASLNSQSYFPLLTRFVVIPATLFSGVFFPVTQLPTLVLPLAYASPLWHAVELCRAAMLGTEPLWPAPAHVGYLLLIAAVGLMWANRAYSKRLKD